MLLIAPFLAFALELPENSSQSVGSGAPRRAGESSAKSTYSPFQAFSASLRGIGGEHEPISTASVEVSLLLGGSSERKVVLGESAAPLWGATITEDWLEAVGKIGTFEIRLALGMPPIVTVEVDVAAGVR